MSFVGNEPKKVISVGTANIEDGAVTEAKLASSAVTDSKLSLAANASNIKTAINASGDAPIYACRAWVNFNGTRNVTNTGASTNGQPVFIRASGNVTSVVKNATGDYTVNFTTAMPDANYAFFGTSNSETTNRTGTLSIQAVSGSKDTTSVRVTHMSQLTSGNVLEDATQCSVSIFR